MSFFALVSGTLATDPQQRTGSTGKPFTTATVRVGDGDDGFTASCIAFGDAASRLLEFSKGEPIAVSGRAKLSAWVGRDGEQRRGLAITIAAGIGLDEKPEPRRKPSGPRKRAHRALLAPSGEIADDRIDDLWGAAP
jgi:single-stranded DNA-binding protein